jgi:short subunit dehydrogenase-like uncharacterized protein
VAEREFDVVVFGATSVTGRRVAEYLAERTRETGLRWAAAARDTGKLKRVLTEAGVEAPATISADVADAESLQAMAHRSSAVVNLVGPYTRYGEPVIEACVAGGSHYLDLTGEIPFAHRMLDRYDARARGAGVKIVQVCGYEALTPDLAVLMASEAARQRSGAKLAEVQAEVAFTAWPPGLTRPSDFASGGTFQSLATAAGDSAAHVLTDPGALIQDQRAAQSVRTRSPIRFTARRSPSGALVVPMMPFAWINPAVIHRTAKLVADEQGQEFEPFVYREGVALTSSSMRPLRLLAASVLTAIQAGIGATSRMRPAMRARVSAAICRALPSSGFGPSAERLQPWRWRMSVFARTSGGEQIEVRVDAEGHPGYLATARMLGEAGMLVAEGGANRSRAGCLTPAVALGTDVIDRFEHARMRFSLCG